jgi:aerobic-type carbon monoxide dehydrogenase small subunit (CoxS/CutS family)
MQIPSLTLRVNGRRMTVSGTPERSLLSVLRNELDLTGAKYGCGEGQCGACAVLIDGKAAVSCMTKVSVVGDREVTTIEGLAKNARLHPVQQAFLDETAFQCGFCTPGMIVAASALLHEKSKPTAAEVGAALEAHVCRCGTYPRIIKAVLLAAKGGSR